MLHFSYYDKYSLPFLIIVLQFYYYIIKVSPLYMVWCFCEIHTFFTSWNELNIWFDFIIRWGWWWLWHCTLFMQEMVYEHHIRYVITRCIKRNNTVSSAKISTFMFADVIYLIEYLKICIISFSMISNNSKVLFYFYDCSAFNIPKN